MQLLPVAEIVLVLTEAASPCKIFKEMPSLVLKQLSQPDDTMKSSHFPFSKGHKGVITGPEDSNKVRKWQTQSISKNKPHF